MDALRTELRGAGKTSDLRREREQNILWVRDLERTGLEHGRLEKRIDFATTARGEVLGIQYPGKEAAQEKRTRPWDFRPKVTLEDGSEGLDLTFDGIWDVLFDILDGVATEEPDVARALATIFYRMAFMLDHEEADPPSADGVQWVPEEPDPLPPGHADERFGPVRRYQPPDRVVRALDEAFPDWGGMSLEAFLHYNDLLAWNEDCKYYYRGVVEDGKDWMGRTGRVNNILSHVTIIGFLMEEVKLSRIAGKFASGAPGVAPATSDEIARITGGLVEKS